MSYERSIDVDCPACGESFPFHARFSVLADRHPKLRDGVLDGSLMRQRCPSCDKVLRLEPEMTYLDMGRGQWILVRPAAEVTGWAELEQTAATLFERSFGARAPKVAREMATDLTVRLAFGWPGLREKLMARELGLDDVSLELVKLAVLRGMSDPPLSDTIELRLMAADDEQLTLAWIRADAETGVETVEVPRALYDEVMVSPEWQPLRAALGQGAFVDMNRLLVGEA
jgi:hypothetical protein